MHITLYYVISVAALVEGRRIARDMFADVTKRQLVSSSRRPAQHLAIARNFPQRSVGRRKRFARTHATSGSVADASGARILAVLLRVLLVVNLYSRARSVAARRTRVHRQ